MVVTDLIRENGSSDEPTNPHGQSQFAVSNAPQLSNVLNGANSTLNPMSISRGSVDSGGV